MHLAVYLPLLVVAVFGTAGPSVARRLPPRTAAWLLAGGGFVASAAAGVSLCLLGFLVVAQTPLLATEGHWSDRVLRRHDHVPALLADAAAVVAVLLLARVALVTRRRGLALRRAYQLAHDLRADHGELTVLDLPEVAAYAVPGRPGAIVATSALLRRLDGPERRAMLAHERAHLTGRHHVLQAAAALAAAGNPFLARLPQETAAACERWADESAAATHPRSTLAAALTHAGVGTALALPEVAMPGVEDVAARIDALHAPPPSGSGWRAGVLCALVLCGALGLAVALKDTERLFELAQAAHRAVR